MLAPLTDEQIASVNAVVSTLHIQPDSVSTDEAAFLIRAIKAMERSIGDGEPREPLAARAKHVLAYQTAISNFVERRTHDLLALYDAEPRRPSIHGAEVVTNAMVLLAIDDYVRG